MRSSIAYYFMLLYLTVMLKPLAPFIIDTLEHTFAETEHIATVHAIYGEHHVENLSADIAAENEKIKSHHTLTEKCNVPFHISVTENEIAFLSNKMTIAFLPFPSIGFSDVLVPPDERPPQVS